MYLFASAFILVYLLTGYDNGILQHRERNAQLIVIFGYFAFNIFNVFHCHFKHNKYDLVTEQVCLASVETFPRSTSTRQIGLQMKTLI